MPKYLDKKWINGKWRYFYDKVGKLGGSAKVSAIRASDAARRGATAILKSTKKAIVNNPISKEKRRKAEAQRLERNRKNRMFTKSYDFDAERFARKYGAVGSGATSREKLKKVASKKYYKSNNAAIAANKKGKSQTEYYRNLQKKQDHRKASEDAVNFYKEWKKFSRQYDKKKAEERRKKDALDTMTSGGSASDRNQLVSARKYGKSLRSTAKSETKRRNNDLNRMTSGGSASDREALRKAAGKKNIAANNKAVAANKKGKSQTEYYKNLAKKQAAAKARKKQNDLDRMTSTSKSDASIFSNTPRRPGYLDLGIDKKGIHYRLNMGKKGKKKTKKGSRSGFSWSYK